MEKSATLPDPVVVARLREKLYAKIRAAKRKRVESGEGQKAVGSAEEQSFEVAKKRSLRVCWPVVIRSCSKPVAEGNRRLFTSLQRCWGALQCFWFHSTPFEIITER